MEPGIGSTWQNSFEVVTITKNYITWDGLPMVSFTAFPKGIVSYSEFLYLFMRNFTQCHICKTCKKVY